MILTKKGKSALTGIVLVLLLVLFTGCSMQTAEDPGTELEMGTGMQTNAASKVYLRSIRRPAGYYYFRHFYSHSATFNFENGMDGWLSTYTNAKIKTNYHKSGKKSVFFRRLFWKIFKMERETYYVIRAWVSCGKNTNDGTVQLGISYKNKDKKVKYISSGAKKIKGYDGKSVKWVEVKFSFIIYEDLASPTKKIPIPSLLFVKNLGALKSKGGVPIYVDDVSIFPWSD